MNCGVGITNKDGAGQHDNESVCYNGEVVIDTGGCHNDTSDGSAYQDQKQQPTRHRVVHKPRHHQASVVL